MKSTIGNHKTVNNLINFLKGIKIGLSEEEIKSTYNYFLTSQNKNKVNKNLEIDNFLFYRFGNEWKYLDHKLKGKLIKYLANIIVQWKSITFLKK